MFLMSAWKPAASFNPNDPSQRVRTLYLPNAGEYRSVYWDKIDTGKANVLNGIMPDSRYAQAGIALALAGVIWFGFRHMRSKGLMGLGRARRRRKRK